MNGESSTTTATGEVLPAAPNIEPDFLSDSSSTISNGSLTNGMDSNDCSKSVDGKSKKNDVHSISIVTKFNSSNFKEGSDRQSESPVLVDTAKRKKKSRGGDSKDSGKKSPQESKDCQDISSKSAAPTFSSMYESFINKDLDGNQSSKQCDKKRNSDFTEEPEKKRSKHSR